MCSSDMPALVVHSSLTHARPVSKTLSSLLLFEDTEGEEPSSEGSLAGKVWSTLQLPPTSPSIPILNGSCGKMLHQRCLFLQPEAELCKPCICWGTHRVRRQHSRQVTVHRQRSRSLMRDLQVALRVAQRRQSSRDP